jgi:hypothetical protein
MRTFSRTLVLSLLALAALAAGCKKADTPVGKLEAVPAQVTLGPGEVQKVRLTWTPSAPLGSEAATVFVHLLDAEKKVVRTYDHTFPQAWTPGTPVSYEVKVFQSAIAPPLPAGKYALTVGLYGKDGDRWALSGLGEPVGRKEYKAADVEVDSQGHGPAFLFTNAWGPVEEGSDRQVVARRWMLNRGAIRLNEQHDAGTVWMVIHIPEEKTEGYELVYDPKATTPMVNASGTCGTTEMSVSGSGQHEVELPVDAPAPGGFCRILLNANFQLKPTTPVGTARSVSVDNLAWIEGAGTPAAAADAAADAEAAEGTPPASPQDAKKK